MNSMMTTKVFTCKCEKTVYLDKLAIFILEFIEIFIHTRMFNVIYKRNYDCKETGDILMASLGITQRNND